MILVTNNHNHSINLLTQLENQVMKTNKCGKTNIDYINIDLISTPTHPQWVNKTSLEFDICAVMKAKPP